MGYIMDTMAFRFNQEWEVVPKNVFLKELKLVGTDIPWTNGSWRLGANMILPWNEVQNTNKHISLITNFIIRKYKFTRKQIPS